MNANMMRGSQLASDGVPASREALLGQLAPAIEFLRGLPIRP